MNSREAVSEKSLMGNTDRKTPCKPMSSRVSGGTSACKKSVVRLFLDLDQIRDPRNLRNTCKILPEPLRVHGKRTHFLPLVFGDLKRRVRWEVFREHQAAAHVNRQPIPGLEA